MKTALLVCAALLTAPAIAKGDAAVVSYDDADLAKATRSASGEVKVFTTFEYGGKTHPVRLAFLDLDSSRRVPPGLRRVALERIEKVLVVDVDGMLKTVEVDGIEKVLRLVESATHSICGRSVVRTFVELGQTTMAIDFERDLVPGEVGGLAVVGPAEPISGSCMITTKDDANDDCDTYAIGGCGGPDCQDYTAKICFPSEGLPYTEWYEFTDGTCTAQVVNWGRDTCYCNSAGGASHKYCWDPVTQSHKPC